MGAIRLDQGITLLKNKELIFYLLSRFYNTAFGV